MTTLNQLKFIVKQHFQCVNQCNVDTHFVCKRIVKVAFFERFIKREHVLFFGIASGRMIFSAPGSSDRIVTDEELARLTGRFATPLSKKM